MKSGRWEPAKLDFLRMVADGDHSFTEQELIRIARAMGVLGKGKGAFCAVLRSPVQPDTICHVEMSIQILEECKKAIAALSFFGEVFLGSHMDVVILMEDCGSDGAGLQKLHHLIVRKLKSDIRIAKGNRYLQLSKLHSSKMEAYDALSFAQMDTGVVDIQDVCPLHGFSLVTIGKERDKVIERFRRGRIHDLKPALISLAENVRSNTIVRQDAPYPSSIRRTMIEILVEMLHIASDLGVDVDAQIGYQDPYRRIFELQSTPEIIDWVVETAERLQQAMEELLVRREDKIIEQVKDYINDHLGDIELGLTSASASVDMSPSYFSAFFIKETGQGFKEYVNEKRVELAQKYLLETTDSINAISERCGFLSPSYFISVFKKRVGISPGVYRKKKN